MFGRSERPERPPFQDRTYRDRDYQPSPQRPQQEQRPYPDRNSRRAQDSNGPQGRSGRDYRPETSIRVDQRAESQMADAGVETNGLPAFITSPVRAPAESRELAPAADAPLRTSPTESDIAPTGFHPRHRRRRPAKPEPELAELRSEEAADDAAQG